MLQNIMFSLKVVCVMFWDFVISIATINRILQLMKFCLLDSGGEKKNKNKKIESILQLNH